ncbi:MAG: hypothetical protein P4L87_15720 [Formivibrio sp.]|nr:hypothetical protein [Formivibrio sp.]
MKNAVKLLITCLFWTTALSAAQYYVSPTGSGNGSLKNPWPLSVALTNRVITHGDFVWLRGGVYSNLYTTTLACSATGAPIIFRNYANEEATIDGQLTITSSSTNVWFWGLEFIDSQKTNRVSAFCTIYGLGEGNKLINCLIHDCCIGTSPQGQAEAYGNIFWNCGKDGLEHCIYWQNASDTESRVIDNNILSNPASLGMQLYGQDAQLKNFVIQNNTMNGAAILLGGGNPVVNALIVSNDMCNFRGSACDLLLGYNVNTVNSNVVMVANYFAAGSPLMFNNCLWNNLVITNNVLYSSNWVVINSLTNLSANVFTWGYNSYFNENPMWQTYLWRLDDGSRGSLAQWRKNGYDLQSTYTNTPPPDRVIVRPNKYEAKRANITVWNWSVSSMVTADVSSVLAVGDTYIIRNGLNYFDAPVASGTYTGQPLQLPMTNLTVAPALYGYIPVTSYENPYPTFGAFLLIGSPAITPPQHIRVVSP